MKLETLHLVIKPRYNNPVIKTQGGMRAPTRDYEIEVNKTEEYGNSRTK